MKIVFFGTSSVAVPILTALHNDASGQYEIAAVVTAPDAAVGRKQVVTPSVVADATTKLGLTVLKPEKVRNNPELLETLRALNANIFIVVSYGKILPLEVINMPRLKTLNVHFSRLPKYRGAAPIQWALLNGETTTATTIFVLDELMDHGLIVAQEETAIQPDDTFETLAHRMADQSAVLLLRVLPDYAGGKIGLKEQNHDEATPTGMITKADGKIDWSEPAQTIYNRYRALQTWPGVWTTWDDKILKILACKPLTNSDAPSNALTNASVVHHTLGTVISVEGTKKIAVVCGNATALELTTVQLEGQKPTGAGSFLNGHKDFISSVLK